jgi:hypothetical protein
MKQEKQETKETKPIVGNYIFDNGKHRRCVACHSSTVRACTSHEIAWHLRVCSTQQTIASASQWKQNWKCKNKYKKYGYAWGSEIL